jgi:acyl carrier protein
MNTLTTDSFCEKLAQVLDLEAVEPASVIQDLPDWDSLAALSVVAMLDSRFGVHIGSSDLKRLSTVQDLMDFVARAGGSNANQHP